LWVSFCLSFLGFLCSVFTLFVFVLCLVSICCLSLWIVNSWSTIGLFVFSNVYLWLTWLDFCSVTL
jgi:hypothetical protein